MVQRRRIRVTGAVQSVGFRPWVLRRARHHGVVGWVRNDGGGVTIEAEGPPGAIDAVVAELVSPPLPHARVHTVECHELDQEGGSTFDIVETTDDVGIGADPIPDLAPCSECIADHDAVDGRRGGHVFATCTACGPRASVTTATVWSRAATTMAPFPLCGACQREHDDPLERRFATETLCCPQCGPRLRQWPATGDGVAASDDAAVIEALVSVLVGGGVAAVKGVGGFHLLGRADLADPVARIRGIKDRRRRPMAVLVADLAAADALVHVDDQVAAVLEAPARPVVLAPRRHDAPLDEGVAPDCADLGVVLPPSLLHRAVASAVGHPLVFTSANTSGAPTATTHDDVAALGLDALDMVVTHDRAIARRLDDAVVRTTAAGLVPVRRGRGTAPAVLRFGTTGGVTTLGVGGHLNNTVAVAAGGRIVASAHVGDLSHPGARMAWESAVAHVTALAGCTIDRIVTDLHPDYASSRWAAERGGDVVAVQHHHAHALATLADHGRGGGAVAITLDGHGLGSDATSWGGEVLFVDGARCERMAHLRPVAHPGGDAASREGWRMAVAWLSLIDADMAIECGRRWDARAGQVLAMCGPALERGAVTSSAGRLLDAVTAIVGLRGRSDFDGDAAICLEAAAASTDWRRLQPRGLVQVIDGVIDPTALVAWAASADVSPALAAATTHIEVAAAFVEAARRAAEDVSVSTVALSGGCFQNRILTERVVAGLTAAGLEPLVACSVPPNDGGLAVGQAVFGVMEANDG